MKRLLVSSRMILTCFIEATPRVEVEIFEGSLEFQFSAT